MKMRKAASLLSVLVLFVATSGVRAADAVDPKTVAIAPKADLQSAAECPEGTQNCKLVCKTFAPPTGTRLGGRTECRTQAWWDLRMRQDQATTVKIQENSYKQVRPGG